mmetsp:Transcript_6504/g.11621  ORF Transcript_6504/g.11621 Transcript_6504/m.11621 type:complete len:131 (+) Transcript_6504:702-1094(+)
MYYNPTIVFLARKICSAPGFWFCFAQKGVEDTQPSVYVRGPSNLESSPLDFVSMTATVNLKRNTSELPCFVVFLHSFFIVLSNCICCRTPLVLTDDHASFVLLVLAQTRTHICYCRTGITQLKQLVTIES